MVVCLSAGWFDDNLCANTLRQVIFNEGMIKLIVPIVVQQSLLTSIGSAASVQCRWVGC